MAIVLLMGMAGACAKEVALAADGVRTHANGPSRRTRIFEECIARSKCVL